MSYALDITDIGADDLVNLLDLMQSQHREDAFIAIEEALNRLAENPLAVPRGRFERPTYLFQFLTGGVLHRWGAQFRFSQDEKTIVVTRLFRWAAY